MENLRDVFGKTYKLYFFGDNLLAPNIKPKYFSDIDQAQRFLQNIDISDTYWRNLAYRFIGNTPYSEKTYESTYQVSHLLLQGRIKIFDITEINNRKNSLQKKAFKKADGQSYYFNPASFLFNNTDNKIKIFTTELSVNEFMEELELESKDLESIADTYSLKIKASSNRHKDVMNAIITALFRKDIVISVKKPAKLPDIPPVIEDVVIRAPTLGPEIIDKEATFKTVDIMGNPIDNVYISIETPEGIINCRTNALGEVKIPAKKGEVYKLLGICPECTSAHKIVKQENKG